MSDLTEQHMVLSEHMSCTTVLQQLQHSAIKNHVVTGLCHGVLHVCYSITCSADVV